MILAAGSPRTRRDAAPLATGQLRPAGGPWTRPTWGVIRGPLCERISSFTNRMSGPVREAVRPVKHCIHDAKTLTLTGRADRDSVGHSADNA